MQRPCSALVRRRWRWAVQGTRYKQYVDLFRAEQVLFTSLRRTKRDEGTQTRGHRLSVEADDSGRKWHERQIIERHWQFCFVSV